MVEVEALLTAIQARIARNSSDKMRASVRKAWQYLHRAVVMALPTGMRKGEYMDSQRGRMDTIWTPAPIPSSEVTEQTTTKYVQ